MRFKQIIDVVGGPGLFALDEHGRLVEIQFTKGAEGKKPSEGVVRYINLKIAIRPQVQEATPGSQEGD